MSDQVWVAVAAAVTALGAVIARWLAERRTRSEQDSTLGHGWSEFAAALREEAAEERLIRKLAEDQVEEMRARVALLEAKCRAFEAHLARLGLPMPDIDNG